MPSGASLSLPGGAGRKVLRWLMVAHWSRTVSMLCLKVVMIWGSVVGGVMLLLLVSSSSDHGVPPLSM